MFDKSQCFLINVDWVRSLSDRLVFAKLVCPASLIADRALDLIAEPAFNARTGGAVASRRALSQVPRPYATLPCRSHPAPQDNFLELAKRIAMAIAIVHDCDHLWDDAANSTGLSLSLIHI